MKTILFTLIMLALNSILKAQSINCEILTNIDGYSENLLAENSFSKDKIIINENISKGIIVSEKEIKLTNGSFGNSNPNSYFLASISNCEIASKQIFQNELSSNHQVNSEEKSITIYPNPTNGVATINWSNYNIEMVTLTSIDGKILKSQTVDDLDKEIKIDLSGLSDGIYQVVINENNNSFLRKIVKN